MKMFRIIIIGSLLLISLVTKGQKFGQKTGLNFTTARWSERIFSSEGMTNIGGQFGFFGEFKFSEEDGGLYFAPEILYTTKGGGINSGGELKIITDINYIELPLSLGYKFNLKRYDIFIKTGPYIGYATNGYYRYQGDDIISKLEFGSDGYFKRYDTGWTFTTGVEIRSIQLGLSYEYGLIDCYKRGNGNEAFRNRVLSFSVGLLFQGSK